MQHRNYSRNLQMRQAVVPLVKTLPTFHETSKLITILNKSLSLVSILSQMNPVHTLPYCFFQMFQYYAQICAKIFQAVSCLQVSYQNPVSYSILFHAQQKLHHLNHINLFIMIYGTECIPLYHILLK